MIIGGGAVSEMFHIPACIHLFGIENVNVCEPNPLQATKIVNKFGSLNISYDYSGNLSTSDFAIIASPPHTHLSIIKSCLDSKITVLCEKPISLNLQEAEEILNIIQESQLPFGMCHTYRFFPNRQEIKELLRNGFFGDNIRIEIAEGDPSSWKTVSGYNVRKELTPGGVLLDAGVHSLDFLLWCLDYPTRIEYTDDSIGGLESNAQLKLSFKSDIEANYRLSRTCSLPNTMTIKGNAGFAVIDLYEMTHYSIGVSSLDKLEAETNGMNYDWTTIARVQIQDFVDAVRMNKQPKATLLDGLNTIKLISECYTQKWNRPLPSIAPIPGHLF